MLPEGWDGFALLVDDVERYIGTDINFSLAAFNSTLPHFFRLAVCIHLDLLFCKSELDCLSAVHLGD